MVTKQMPHLFSYIYLTAFKTINSWIWFIIIIALKKILVAAAVFGLLWVSTAS